MYGCMAKVLRRRYWQISLTVLQPPFRLNSVGFAKWNISLKKKPITKMKKTLGKSSTRSFQRYMGCLSKFLSEHYKKLSESYVGRTPPPKRLKRLKLLIPLVYNRRILFLRRIYEKGSFVAWFRRCIDDDANTAIVRRRDAKLIVITLVRSRGHLIGATRTHDLQMAILANQGAPGIIPKYRREGLTECSWFDWIQLVGLTHRFNLQGWECAIGYLNT